jgi:hypothetical protein
MSAVSSLSESPPSVVTALAPLMIAVLTGFLVIGAALPVLPLHVHDGLGFGPVMVGVVVRRGGLSVRRLAGGAD